jgi:hypothetical protein
MRAVICLAAAGVLLAGCDWLKTDKKDQGSTPPGSASMTASGPGSSSSASQKSAPASSPMSGPASGPASTPPVAPPPVEPAKAPAYTDPANTPGAVAKRFYEAYATLHHSGLPTEAERLMLQDQLTPSLSQLLKAAIAADAARPPSKRFKGDPFTANPKGATTVNSGWCNWSDTGDCHPDLTNAAETWHDIVLVNDVEVHGKWRVSDVEYNGTRSGDRLAKLSDTLKGIAEGD